MGRDRILAILREHEQELRGEGLVHLRLFGSAARGEETPESDVDLMAEFDPLATVSLLTLSRVHYTLEDLLGKQVDLSSADSMYPIIKARALAEAVVAF